MKHLSNEEKMSDKKCPSIQMFKNIIKLLTRLVTHMSYEWTKKCWWLMAVRHSYCFMIWVSMIP